MSPRSAVHRVAAASLISFAGSEAAFTAFLFLLYERTGSAQWLSTALLVTNGVGAVLSPVAGAIGDRFDRRRVMIVSDLLGAACWMAMAFVQDPVGLMVLAFVARAIETPFFPASSGAVPNLVPARDLSWANGTIAAASNIGYLAGPVAGGAIAAGAGPEAAFVANAASFVVSAALVAGVRAPFSGRRDPENGVDGGLRAGFLTLLSDRVLRTMTLAFIVFALAVGSVMVAELPLAEYFGAGSFGFGLIATFFGVGALLGSLGARRVPQRAEHAVLVACSFVTAAGFTAVGFAPAFTVVLGAMLVSGVSDGAVDVAIQVILQRRTRDEVRSRAIAALEAMWHGGLALSFVFAGWLVDAVGPKATYLWAGAGLTVSAFMLVPLLRPAPALAEPGRLPGGEDIRA